MTDVVVVAGMHRSGTSLVARVVNLLGVDLGRPSSMMDPKPDNPTGFWESRPVAALNDDLLGELGGSWNDPPFPLDGWEHDTRFEPWRERARAIVDAEFGAGGTVGWKDPRMSLLLPFWRTVVDVVTVLIVIRDPAEVAASLHARDGTDPEDAAALWLAYTVGAAKHAPGAHVVRYDDFFSDVDRAADDLASALERPPPGDATRAEIRAFFDPDLRHHRDASLPGPTGAAATWLFRSAQWPLPADVADLLWDGLREFHGGPSSASSLTALAASLEDDRAGLEQRVQSLEGQRSALEEDLALARTRVQIQADALEREERIGRLLRERLQAASAELTDLKSSLAPGESVPSEGSP